MKKILIAILVFVGYIGFGQVPMAFTFQSVATDANGNVIANQNVNVKTSIIANLATGHELYTETHSTTTNNNGLFNISIGNGEPTNGTFLGINWSGDKHFIKTEIDITGGANYVFAGTIQLLAVPYALHVAEATVVLAKGERGNAGRRGVAGPEGPQGSTGEPGVQGTLGPGEGCNCENDPNWVGPQGPQGAQGPKGEDAEPGGPMGERGPAGPQGQQGDSGGPEGIPGEMGITGPEGPIGPYGPIGDRGVEGPQGDQGPAEGPAGDTGPDGPPGAEGPEGPTGAEGMRGPSGARGPKGPQGDPGPGQQPCGVCPRGDQGPEGPKGLTGLQGANGFGIMIMRNTIPSAANVNVGDFYVDDGTNTADGQPHLRVLTANGWLDL